MSRQASTIIVIVSEAALCPVRTQARRCSSTHLNQAKITTILVEDIFIDNI